MQYAATYYRRPDGTQTGEVHAIRSAVVALGEKFRREREAEQVLAERGIDRSFSVRTTSHGDAAADAAFARLAVSRSVKK